VGLLVLLAKVTPTTILLTSSTKFGRLSSSESPLPSSRWGSSLTASVHLSPKPSSSEFRPCDGA
jgi:hypothetical protein